MSATAPRRRLNAASPGAWNARTVGQRGRGWWGHGVAFVAGIVAAYALALLVVVLTPPPVARVAWAEARAVREIGARAVYVLVGRPPG